MEAIQRTGESETLAPAAGQPEVAYSEENIQTRGGRRYKIRLSCIDGKPVQINIYRGWLDPGVEVGEFDCEDRTPHAAGCHVRDAVRVDISATSVRMPRVRSVMPAFYAARRLVREARS